MMVTINRNYLYFFLVPALFFALGSQGLCGQNIYLTGPTSVAQGSTNHYSVGGGNLGNDYDWYTTFYDDTSSFNSYGGDVLWGTAGTNYLMVDYFSNYNLYYAELEVQVASSAPVTPGSPTIAINANGTATLQRSGTPPSGVTWYWQGKTSNGTSTGLGSGATYTANQGSGTYYIRARNGSGTWSTGSGSVYVTISPLPTWYSDTVDQDGLGDPNVSVSQVTAPANYVSNNLDLCPSEFGLLANNGCPVCGPSDENYIRTTTPRVPATSTSGLLDGEKIESITYFDGLGRPMQGIGIRAGGNSEDIVTHIGYDTYGRQVREYLPYAVSSACGTYQIDALASTSDFYELSAKYGYTANPYSQKEFEPSPLNRILKQAAPGYDWRLGGGHEIRFDYGANTFDPNSPTNTANDNVRLYRVTLVYANRTYTPTLNLDSGSNGYFLKNQLYKTVTKDENWTSGKAYTTEEFTDKQGRVVLKRTYGDSKVGTAIVANAPHDTYYVYDNFGNLTYVLPPKMDASSVAIATVKNQLDELGYQYEYDHRNRLVEKKIPGKGWEHIVYNKLDRPILTQDANLKTQNKWLFTKYDAFGRVAYTGEMTKVIERPALQTDVDLNTSQFVIKQASSTTIDGTAVYYNNGAYPTADITEILTINYYDNYTFDLIGGASSDSYTVTPIANAKGLATGSKVRVLGSNHWITTVTHYDAKSRPIYVYSNNPYLGTTDKVMSKLDFVGNIEESTATHEKTGKAMITLKDYYDYDDAGRLLAQRQKINSLPEETIVANTYDNLGQLTTKGVGGKTGQARLQNVDFAYNIRGWLKQINDPASLGTDLFAFKINYNTNDHGGTNLFNGNISETEWRTTNVDNSLHWYKYDYDALNRLTNATDNFGKLKETLNYDKNGNIADLVRLGHLVGGTTIPNINITQHFGIMDNLVYNYEANSNKLKKVSDTGNKTYGFKDGTNSGDDYTYDANGNMVSDANKGISNITYNYLNLPKLISLGNENISYIYDAAGTKLSKKVVESGKTDAYTYYAGNYVYAGSSLKFFNHPEGYVEAENGFEYVYQYKDHLGNIRLSYQNTDSYEKIIDSDFTNDMDGWQESGSVNYSLDSGRLKANVDSSWEGVAHSLNGFTTAAGEVLKVKITFDKGNTQSSVRLYLHEVDANGNLVDWNVKDWNLQTGTFEYSHDMAYSGNSIIFRVDKDNTNTGTETYFYIDHVSLTQNDLEILEENNYYPFGLQHKGYNNVVNGTENNYQTFQGQEEEKELGKNTYAFQWRDYDPAIGRFNKIDRFAEKYYDQSPYNFTKNSPMVFTEVKGDSIKVSFRTGFLGIFGKKETLTYDSKNEQWNDANGKQYTGKTSKFSDKVLGDLKSNQKNELGNEIVSNLANDNIDHFVKKGSPNSNTINDVNIYYNGSVSDDGQKIYQNGKSGSSPGYVVLGHEMAHKYSRNLGVRNVPWFGAGTAGARGVDEYNAMYYENVLRGANGLPLRSAYTENNGNLQGTILNSSGNLQSPPTLLSTQSAPTMPAVHAVLIINQILNRF